jgi:hypothetical protein
MSRENVESVRDAIDAVNRSDWDGAFKGAAPGFELDLRGPRRISESSVDTRPRWLPYGSTGRRSRDFQVEIEVETRRLLTVPLTGARQEAPRWHRAPLHGGAWAHGAQLRRH